jgi:hypothetical protein
MKKKIAVGSCPSPVRLAEPTLVSLTSARRAEQEKLRRRRPKNIAPTLEKTSALAHAVMPACNRSTCQLSYELSFHAHRISLSSVQQAIARRRRNGRQTSEVPCLRDGAGHTRSGAVARTAKSGASRGQSFCRFAGVGFER